MIHRPKTCDEIVDGYIAVFVAPEFNNLLEPISNQQLLD